MPIFKKSNNFSKNFNKKTPFKKERRTSQHLQFVIPSKKGSILKSDSQKQFLKFWH